MAVVGFRNPNGPATLLFRNANVGPDGSHRGLAKDLLRSWILGRGARAATTDVL